MSKFLKTALRLLSLISGEDGQGLTEYALILALVGLITVAALSLLGGHITSILTTVARSA